MLIIVRKFQTVTTMAFVTTGHVLANWSMELMIVRSELSTFARNNVMGTVGVCLLTAVMGDLWFVLACMVSMAKLAIIGKDVRIIHSVPGMEAVAGSAKRVTILAFATLVSKGTIASLLYNFVLLFVVPTALAIWGETTCSNVIVIQGSQELRVTLWTRHFVPTNAAVKDFASAKFANAVMKPMALTVRLQIRAVRVLGVFVGTRSVNASQHSKVVCVTALIIH